VVVLVREPDNAYLGIAYLLLNFQDTTGFLEYAVIDQQHIVNYHVMTHEIGHLFGCAHDVANAGGQGLFPYSYGQYFVGNSGKTWGTIMSYPGQRIPYFSNPELTYDGQPTGASGVRDNARTIRISKHFVSGYRSNREDRFDLAYDNGHAGQRPSATHAKRS
jgi:peptidyl-Asp metalloendopeptidase